MDKKISKVMVLSKAGGICTIKPKTKVKVTSGGRAVNSKLLQDGSIQFNTVTGGKYVLEVLK
jgi:hypothetical protein